jgi:hypothetical protein
MCTPTQSEHDLFRILLYRNNTAEILLETVSHGFRLPTVPVPARARVAEEITAALRHLWNLETYCLFPLPDDTLGQAPVCCQVVESCRADAIPPAEMRWLQTVELPTVSFEASRDLAIIQNSRITLDQYRSAKLPGFFGRPGWLRVILEWVQNQVATAGLSLTGEFLQLNANPTSSLVRFETNGAALWFKAVGEPNAHEYGLTLHLADLFPSYLPHVIASKREWNAWLMREVEGIHPDAGSGIRSWATVARSLAALQIASIGYTGHFIESGSKDVCVRALAESVDPFLDVMTDLMDRQSKESPAPLSRDELAVLGQQLKCFLRDYEHLDVPNTLGHLDFNPGNVIVSGERCVFLDWARACAGHPFLTFQYLLEHLRRLRPNDSTLESALIAAYSETWQGSLTKRQIEDALAISPLLAVLACAVSGSAWRSQTKRHEPRVARYLRSLTRRMKRETDLLRGRNSSCIR